MTDTQTAKTATAPTTNRRRHKRLPTSIRIISQVRGTPFSDAVKDISFGGVQVQTNAPLPVGTQSEFMLQLPHHEAPLHLHGRVVWSTPTAFGVAFDRSEPKLSAFVDRLERDAARF